MAVGSDWKGYWYKKFKKSLLDFDLIFLKSIRAVVKEEQLLKKLSTTRGVEQRKKKNTIFYLLKIPKVALTIDYAFTNIEHHFIS